MNKIYFDTNIYIYLFQNHPIYGETARNLVEKARLDAIIVSSSYTIFELLKWPTTKKVLDQLKNNFLNLDVLQIVDMNLNIVRKSL